MGMNLTIGIAIAGYVFLIKYLYVGWKSTFHHCWQYGSNIIFEY
jgi:hypothetical protein